LLVATQVVLTIQLPFAIYPLIRFTSSKRLMGSYASGPLLAGIAWLIFALILACNIWLLWQLAV
jgi:manganese transport protein